MKVQHGVVDLQGQRLQQHRHRFGMAPGLLQRCGHRHEVGVVGRKVCGHCAQAIQRLVRTPQRQQGARFQRVAEQLLRVQFAHATRALHRFGGAATLDQRMRGGQAIGSVGVQLGGLLEGGRGSTPPFPLGMALPGLPLPEGLKLHARCGGRTLRSGNGQ